MKILAIFLLCCTSMTLSAQDADSETETVASPIAVEDVTADGKIERRLRDILAVTGHYENVKVHVISGVVILSGMVEKESQIEWAQSLALRLDGVVAVQNQIVKKSRDLLDLTPAKEEFARFHALVIRHFPVLILSLVVLILSFVFFFLTSRGAKQALRQRISSPLLLNAIAKMLSIPVFLIGLYMALRISGLTGLAFTLLGGTGLLGLALGLGLKNGFEDYAAGIVLSIKKPFRPSDWVSIGEFEGIVQNLTSRSTLIMDFEGNHVLIPNGFVYRSVITNKSANPKMRGNFVLGIDYRDSIDDAQTAILNLLAKNDLVQKDPEPWVLVDELSGSSVNLRVYYWVNVREVSIFKVSSHLLREVKKLLLAEGFRFPDPHREIVFTNSLAVGHEAKKILVPKLKDTVNGNVKAADVRAEASDLNRLARDSDFPDQGKDIL